MSNNPAKVCQSTIDPIRNFVEASCYPPKEDGIFSINLRKGEYKSVRKYFQIQRSCTSTYEISCSFLKIVRILSEEQLWPLLPETFGGTKLHAVTKFAAGWMTTKQQDSMINLRNRYITWCA